jgi:dihydrofolate reductase
VGIVRVAASVSLDGFSAGPDVSEAAPMGVGGERLHRWLFASDGDRNVAAGGTAPRAADAKVAAEAFRRTGAVIVGRLTYDIGADIWGDVPFPVPTFVVTSRPHAPRPMRTETFTFVTDGIGSALDQARSAAGERDVLVMGGATIQHQYVAAGLVDEIEINLVPVLLHRGVRLFDGSAPGTTELVRTGLIPTDEATHLTFSVTRPAGRP